MPILAHTEAGTGRPLVLLHAFPLDQAMWQPQLDGLAAHVRVIAVDLPGFGGSAPRAEPFTVDGAADAVADFLTGVGLTEPVVLGGLSMGGYVAMAFARRHPARLAGLLLADTRAEPDDDSGRAARNEMIAFAQANGAAAVIEKILPKLLGPATGDDVKRTVREIGARQGRAMVAAALAALRDRPDAGPQLAAVRVPTLVLVGEHDAVTPTSMAQVIAAQVSGSRFVVIPGAGHLTNMENPAAFNAAVREWLSGVG